MATESEFLKKFTRELPVDLNDGELQTYGKMLAEKVREKELAEDKKKQATSVHAATIKTISNEIKRIAEARSKGAELRPVACGERLHGNVIEIVRLDTSVVVDTRPADLQDLQTTMPGFDTSDVAEPDGFDDGAGDSPDNVLPFTGANVTSSAGDTVHVGDTEDRADGFDDEPDDERDDESAEAGGGLSDVKPDAEPDSTAPVDEDAWLDEKLDQRAKDMEADAASKTVAPKASRERSKKANAAKGTPAKPKKKK